MVAFLLFVIVILLVVVLVRQGSLSRRLDALERERGGMRPQPVGVPSYPAPPPVQRPATSAQQPAPVATAAYRPTYIPPPPPMVPAAPRAAAEVPPPVPPHAVPPAVSFSESKPPVSLEAKLGQSWLNKIGIVSVVLGIALGLGRVLPSMGPVGKSLLALAVALGILGLGLWLERRETYRVFARACIGGGWALVFFLSFAVYHLPALRIVGSEAADLVLMLAVASGMVAHSLRYRSQTVTTIAFLLAFLTVGISDVTVFSLVAGALLAGALCFVVARERWYALGLAGLVGVYLNHYLWLRRVLPAGGQAGVPFAGFVPSVALLLAYWLVFRLVYVLRPPVEDARQGNAQALASLTAILNSVGLLTLLKYQASHPEWTAWALLALGVAELGFATVARRREKGVNANRVAFTVLATLSAVMLLAAVPARFAGVTWPLLWLGEAETFFLVGVLLPEAVFRRLGVLGALLTGALLGVVGTVVFALHAGSSLNWRMTQLTVALVAAALLLWCNAELATRRWPAIAEKTLDRGLLALGSYLASGLSVVALGVLARNETAWLGLIWMGMGTVLAVAASRLKSRDLATQSELVVAVAVLRTLWVNVWIHEVWHGVSLGLVTVGSVTVLLYASAARWRSTSSRILPAGMAEAVESWVATGLAALLVWQQVHGFWRALVWGALGLALFEAGLRLRREFLRHQAYAVLLLSFAGALYELLGGPGAVGTIGPRLSVVLPLIAAFAWVYERVQRSESATALDRAAGTAFGWAAVAAAAALIRDEVRPQWVVLGWSLLLLTLLGLACALKRTIFAGQAMAMLAVVALDAVLLHIVVGPAHDPVFVNGRVFTVGLTCVLLLLGLPMGFFLRRTWAEKAIGAAGLEPLLKHPEQPLFFVPLGLLTLLLAVQLHGAVITIGWAVLGLAAFLFALAVRERSFRLSGLGLLLLGVVKVLLWDVWHAPLVERYVTLIVMGVVLLLVSFLYSRYRETLLKFL